MTLLIASVSKIADPRTYLADVLERKPGALAEYTPLAQWHSQVDGRRNDLLFWQRMIERSGHQNGAREMISLLPLGQRTGSEQLAVLSRRPWRHRCTDAAAAVRYLLTAIRKLRLKPDAIELGALARYERPLPTLEAATIMGPAGGRAMACVPTSMQGSLDPRALQDLAHPRHRGSVQPLRRTSAARDTPITISEALLAAKKLKKRKQRGITWQLSESQMLGD